MRQPSIPLDGEPSTGEPDAGEPPVRFGGKGGAETRLSYPYRGTLLEIELIPPQLLTLRTDPLVLLTIRIHRLRLLGRDTLYLGRKKLPHEVIQLIQRGLSIRELTSMFLRCKDDCAINKTPVVGFRERGEDGSFLLTAKEKRQNHAIACFC